MQYTTRLFGFLICLFFALPLFSESEGIPLAFFKSDGVHVAHRPPSTVHRLPFSAGHRIEITNIEVIKLKSKSFQIYVDVVNTGRFDIKMGEGKRLPYLEIGFDESLDGTGLTEHQDAIRKKLLAQDIRIRIGETKKRVFLKVKITKKTVDTPTYSVPPPVKRSEPVADTKTEIPVKKTTPKPLPKPTVDTRPKKSPSEKKKKDEGGFSIPIFEKKSLDELVAEKEACPDLIIESVRLVKANNKKATIEYVIKNIGKGTAELYDNSDKNDKPIGIRAYISGSPELSKGSFAIDGSFITSGLGALHGNLEPDQSLTVTAVLDIRRKTRYMPNIILTADAFLKLAECDRTNNTNSVLLE